MTFFVTKRDGRKESYDVDKIKKCIELASDNLDVNPLELESKFNKVLYDGITTDEIQENLIEHSKQLCSPTCVDWSFVAGRLKTMQEWANRHIFERSFYYYLKEQIENGVYKHPGLIKGWTKKQINELEKEIDHIKDLNHSYGSILTGLKKYLMPGEYLQYMFMCNAMIIASVENNKDKVEFAKEIYKALSNRKLSMASPWNSNLRANSNISSCFIISIDDSIESITNAWKNAAMISKLGGGLGIDLSRIRAAGSEINGNPGASNGVITWCKVFNDISIAVDQCFHENTLIKTKLGLKKIKDINNEDKVLTHDGSYKKVIELLKANSKNDNIYNINTNEASIKVTESHPVLVVTGSFKGLSDSDIINKLKLGSLTYKWVDAKDVQPGDKIIEIQDD